MSLTSTIPYRTYSNKTASGEILAAVTAKSIVITSMVISASATSTVLFRSADGSGTVLSGTLNLAAGVPFVLPNNYDGHFTTVAGEALYATITGTVNMSFTFTYRLV